jgi:exopolysaccharide production protein ExoQ
MAAVSQLRRRKASRIAREDLQIGDQPKWRSMDRYEFLLGVMALISILNPFVFPILPHALNSILQPLIWALTSFLVLLRIRHTLYVMSRSWLLWFLLILETVSCMWSSDFDYSLLASRDFLRMLTTALFIGSRFALREQFYMALCALGFGAFMSVIAVVGFPVVGVHGSEFPGAWRGVFGHKNALGSYASMLMIMSFLLAIDPEKKKPIAWWGVIFSAIMVLKTTSKTSLVISVVALGVVYFCCNFRWRGKKAIVILDLAIMTSVITLGLIISMWVPLVQGLGKDATISGRTPIWASIWSQVSAHPFFGFGRAGFFAPGSPYSQQTYADIGFWIPHAHNGYLELFLDIGLFGFAVFLAVFFLAYSNSIHRVLTAQYAGDFFPLALLVVLTINNLTESFLFYQTSVYQVLLVSTIQAMSRPRCLSPQVV